MRSCTKRFDNSPLISRCARVGRQWRRRCRTCAQEPMRLLCRSVAVKAQPSGFDRNSIPMHTYDWYDTPNQAPGFHLRKSQQAIDPISLTARRVRAPKEITAGVCVMFLRTFVVFGVLAAACSAALAQGGCTSYRLWSLSGYAGDSPSTPGSPQWSEEIDNMIATYGGIGPTCSYTWVPGGIDPHWSGECYAIAYTCSTTPLPAAAAAAETSPGPSCHSSKKPDFLG